MIGFSSLLILFSILHFSASSAESGVQFSAPSIISGQEDVVLNSGDVFIQQCSSSEPVRWIFGSSDEDASLRVSVSHSVRPDGLYLATIKVGAVNYLDVGFKYCALNSTASDSDAITNATTASLYLYVNDSEHLLSLNSSQTLTLLNMLENKRAVVVCKPTSPDVNVTLVSLHTPPISVESIFVYDPRHGFVVEKPRREVLRQSLFDCQARRADQTQDHKFLVNVIAPKRLLGVPIVEIRGARNVVVGDNVTLRCLIPISDTVQLSWQVPGASVGLKVGRMLLDKQTTIFTQILPNQPDQEVFIRELHVQDARLEDSGTYQCTARDDFGNNESNKIKIIVHDENSASVKLIAHSKSFEAAAGTDLTVAVEVDAYPAPQFFWYRPDDRSVDQANDTGKYLVVSLLHSIVLEIRNLTLQDAGIYRLEARSDEASDTIRFNVTVTDEARTYIKGAQLYYTALERYYLQCSVTGYPLPIVQWQFSACFSNFTCLSPVNVSQEMSANMEIEEQRQVSASEVNSILEVTAVQSGSYLCVASNGPEVSTSTSNFVVTDVPGGFGANLSHEVVVAGDRVSLTCSANQFHFPDRSSLQWYLQGDGGRQVVSDNSGWNITDESTIYSFRKILTANGVSQMSSANYTCEAKSGTGNLQSANIALRVLDGEAPFFIDGSGMNSSDTLVVPRGEAVLFNCTVQGLPTPDIVWFKDGERLDQALLSGQQRFRLVDGGQRLLMTAVISDDSGRYQCMASNRLGVSTGSLTLLVPSEGHSALVVVGVAFVMLLVFVPLFIALMLKIRKQKKLQHRLTSRDLETFTNGLMSQYNPALSIEEQAGLLPYDLDWEFPKQRLILGPQIGSGAFGRVVKAEAVGILPHEERTVVAVKMPRSESDPSQIKSLMAELKIMIHLGRHLNVVNLLGAVTRLVAQGQFYVLVEYCRYGNLHEYLLNHKQSFISQLDPTTGEYNGEELDGNLPSWTHSPERIYKVPRPQGRDCSIADSSTYLVGSSTCASLDTSRFDGSLPHYVSSSGTSVKSAGRTHLTTRDLINWSYQVASGMQYLASRKLLHGDLAARNILLADHSIVKISDFGLSRDIYKTQDYKKTAKGLLPVKWMAIESIQDSIFSTESDVWSFGVVLWEFFSLGSSPYPGMEYDINFVRRLCDGFRMSMPPLCPKSLYGMMRQCWSHLPSDRPTFSALASSLSQQLEKAAVEEYRRRQQSYDRANEDYFSKRAIYINQIVTGDYQNVDASQAEVGEVTHMLDSAVTDVDTDRQTALFSKLPTTDGGTGFNVSPEIAGSVSSDLDDSQRYLVPRSLNRP